jgi:hypothetical protein
MAEYVCIMDGDSEKAISLRPVDYITFGKQWHICVFIENMERHLTVEEIYDLARGIDRIQNGEEETA